MAAQDYPITTPYGQVPGYPLNGGFHRGEDRAMPVGTPVVVNGVTIGLSGNTGASTGPHLHIGRWEGATVTNPSGGGFMFGSATVDITGSDTTNGNFVKVTADGATWVYLHLSKINVSKGQVLKGGTMPDKIDVNTSRILSHGVLARNGITGRAYSLDGSAGDPWVGGELTNKFLNDVFNSPEAKGWRDSNDLSSVKDINAKLAQIPVLEKQVADLKAQLANAPTSGGLTAEQAAQLTETNSIVKQIWSKLTSVFK